MLQNYFCKESKLVAKEIPFWADEWFDIKFQDLAVPLSSKNLATSDFYNAFYNRLFSKYRGFETLPAEWRQSKKDTAYALGDEMHKNAIVLSYGCGIGYIEKILAEKRPDISLTAHDFADTAKLWIGREITNLKYVDRLDTNNKFDVIYLCQVLYALSQQDAVRLLKILSNNLKKEGKIILVNTSIDLIENNSNYVANSRLTILQNFKRWGVFCFRLFFPYEGVQLWGWKRNFKCYLEISKESQLNLIETFSRAGQNFMILNKES